MEIENRDVIGSEISFREICKLRANLNILMGTILDISTAIDLTPETRQVVEARTGEAALEPLFGSTARSLTSRERDEAVGRCLNGCHAFLDIIRKLDPDSHFDKGLRSTALMLVETIANTFRLDQKSVKELGPQSFTARDINQLGALVRGGRRKL